MKAKDFFRKTTDQGKIKNEDFEKVIETFPDVELPDLWVNMFNENFLTRERAVSDDKINKKIWAEALNAVDDNIKRILPLLDVKDREEIEKEVSSYKKIAMLEKAIPNLVSKAKEENPNVTEKVKLLEKELLESGNKFTEFKKLADDNVKAIQKQYEEEKASLKLDWTLDKKLADYTFADEYILIKPAIIKNIVDTVKGSNALQLDDKGQIVVVDIDPATKVARPKFTNGNDPVTIDNLISEPLKPFLKKNNSKDDKKVITTDNTRRRETQDEIDPSKMTLQQRRALAVNG